MALQLITEQHEGLRALKLIDDFFDRYNLETCDEQIWELVTTYFSVPDGELKMAKYRSATVYFCQDVLFLLKGFVKILNEAREENALSN